MTEVDRIIAKMREVIRAKGPSGEKLNPRWKLIEDLERVIHNRHCMDCGKYPDSPMPTSSRGML
jgi:hypothetical protein